MTERGEHLSAMGGERATTLLERMSTLCAELEHACDTHDALLKNERYQDFIASLSERGASITALDRVSRELAGLLDPESESLTLPERDRVSARVDEFAKRVQKVLERDAAHQAAIEKERDALSSQLSGMRSSKSAMRAYGDKGRTPAAKFQDFEG